MQRTALFPVELSSSVGSKPAPINLIPANARPFSTVELAPDAVDLIDQANGFSGCIHMSQSKLPLHGPPCACDVNADAAAPIAAHRLR